MSGPRSKKRVVEEATEEARTMEDLFAEQENFLTEKLVAPLDDKVIHPLSIHCGMVESNLEVIGEDTDDLRKRVAVIGGKLDEMNVVVKVLAESMTKVYEMVAKLSLEKDETNKLAIEKILGETFASSWFEPGTPTLKQTFTTNAVTALQKASDDKKINLTGVVVSTQISRLMNDVMATKCSQVWSRIQHNGDSWADFRDNPYDEHPFLVAFVESNIDIVLTKKKTKMRESQNFDSVWIRQVASYCALHQVRCPADFYLEPKTLEEIIAATPKPKGKSTQARRSDEEAVTTIVIPATTTTTITPPVSPEGDRAQRLAAAIARRSCRSTEL